MSEQKSYWGKPDWHAKGLPTPDELRAMNAARTWRAKAETFEEAQVSIVFLAFAPDGRFYPWQPATTLRGKLRDWWRRRHGWTFYDGDGRRA